MMIDYSKYTIIVDIDDTIEDLLGAWCKWLDRVYNLNVQPLQISEWDMTKAFPTLTAEQIYEPLQYQKFWRTVKPRIDAQEYLSKLHNLGFQIYLCTSTNYNNVAIKYELIVQRYFPYVDWKHVIIASNKNLIKRDFIIDDGIHNLECCDGTRILMSSPHNLWFDAEEHGIHRVKTWEEIYEIIFQVINEMEVEDYNDAD